MIKDLKKFLEMMKLSKSAAKLLPSNQYHDGFERLVNRIHPKLQKVKIIKITQLSNNVKLFRLVASNHNKQLAFFRAGQYLGVKVNIDGVHTSRAYSIVSSPNNVAYYEIAVKNLGNLGFVSKYLNEEVKMGDVLELTEPMGSFHYNSLFHGKDLVFIAGGCGVTPFISIIKDIYEKDLDLNVHLIYGCLGENDRLFLDELELMVKERENLDVTWVLSEPSVNWNGLTGFITKEILSKVVDDWSNKMVYFVGPNLMKTLILKNLDDLNIKKHRILCEIAPSPPDITRSKENTKIEKSKTAKCTINWTYAGKVYMQKIEVLCSEPLLNSIERAKLKGVIVNNACRSGECAFCRTRLLLGNVFVPSNVHLREMDGDIGFIHPCVSYPIDDLEIELFIS